MVEVILLSEAWLILNNIVEDENRDIVNDNVMHNFQSLALMVGESAREYIAKAKGLGSTVQHNGVEVPDENISTYYFKVFPNYLCSLYAKVLYVASVLL